MRSRGILGVFLLLILVTLWWSCRQRSASPPAGVPQPAPSAVTRSGPEGIYPDPRMTPGTADPRVTQDNVRSTICVPGYTKTVRPPLSVTGPLKRRIMVAYGFSGSPHNYELDHLIPLELGGCPGCVSNLWPEAYRPSPGARQKDKVENYLHQQVCRGSMSLEEAQREITTDWYAVYQEIER